MSLTDADFPPITEYSQYKGDKLCIDIYENFITTAAAAAAMTAIMKYGTFRHPHMTKAGTPSKRRNKIIYGDEDVPYYKFTYMNKDVFTRINSWTSLPILRSIRDKIKELTGQHYHVCVVQLYNCGEVGIDPHRDKEMEPGTIIASLSLGETRIMRFSKAGYETVDIALPAGTLCLMNPPTNDYWLHSIPKDKTTAPRISLVFRNCEKMRRRPAFQLGAADKIILPLQ
jgi:alkylated DNA repair dioxygenase AlkB